MITLIFSSQSKMAQLNLKKLLDQEHPDRNEYNFVSLDMGVSTVDELINECELHSLCFDKKAVVAENCFFLDKPSEGKKKKKVETSNKFEQYVNNEDPSTDLYLLYYSDSIDLDNPIFQAIKEKGRILEVKKLTPGEWIKYIDSYFAKKDYKIEQDAINELYNRTNGDYAFFLNEADKLMAYKLEEKNIEHCDVISLVPPKIEEDDFKLCNALTSGDIAGAIKIYKDLKIHSINEITLIGILASQFIFYDKVKYLDSKGLDAKTIASELKQRNPNRVYMTLKTTRKLTSSSISRILDELYELDANILAGKVNPEFGFSRFLANFSL